MVIARLFSFHPLSSRTHTNISLIPASDHFGVVRALLDANLLPRVITGTSAGAIIAAFLCTRTDEELKLMLTPALADKITACEEGFFTWIQRFIKTGARFSTIEWARKASFFTMVGLSSFFSSPRRFSY